MSELFEYHRIYPTTWVYFSSLLMITLYFKFSRLWSVRNFDLCLLIGLAPGLLIINYGPSSSEETGYICLLSVSALLLVRLLIDPSMVRRPLLEANLSAGGQAFLCISLFLFLMANVVNGTVRDEDLVGPRSAQRLLEGAESGEPEGEKPASSSFDRHGPGFRWMFLLPRISTEQLFATEDELPLPPEPTVDAEGNPIDSFDQQVKYRAEARAMAILSHLAIVLGIIMIGYRHFDNIKTGITAATLYLLMPYTAQMTGYVDHVVLAALLIWALERYRQPLAAGLLMGLAIGVNYYPVFLLPLWISFYWQRGLVRFLVGTLLMVAMLVGTLALTANDWNTFTTSVMQMLGLRAPIMEGLDGIWKFIQPQYRWPVLALFGVLCGSFAVWPAQKNLGTLMSCSAALMLGTQFWHAYGGGLFVAWYLPLTLLTVFRPNLEDRVALTVLGESWFQRRKVQMQEVNQAA